MIDYRENNHWTVYVHTSPSGKMYVGITKLKPEKRWRVDGKGYFNSANIHFINAIKFYGFDNFTHDIVASNLTKTEAENMEKLLIKKLKTQDRRYGYNIAAGGSGGNNKKTYAINLYSIQGEYIATFISAASTARYIENVEKIEHYDRTYITRVCKKHGQILNKYQVRYYDEVNNCENIELYRRKTQKEVFCFSSETKEFICKFDFVKDAVEFSGYKFVSTACKRRCSSSGKYIWRYKEDVIEKDGIFFIVKN